MMIRLKSNITFTIGEMKCQKTKHLISFPYQPVLKIFVTTNAFKRKKTQIVNVQSIQYESRFFQSILCVWVPINVTQQDNLGDTCSLNTTSVSTCIEGSILAHFSKRYAKLLGEKSRNLFPFGLFQLRPRCICISIIQSLRCFDTKFQTYYSVPAIAFYLYPQSIFPYIHFSLLIIVYLIHYSIY